MSRTERHTLSTANKLADLEAKISKGDTAVQTAVQQVGIFGNDNDEWRSVSVDSSGRLEIASSGSLPAGASTEAKQDDMITKLTAIEADTGSLDTKIPSQGQALKASSLPVTIASDQGALLVDGSSVTQPISAAALPLPSGAASSALQTSGNASLTTIAGDTTSIDTKTPALGQALKSGSVPITIASDQGTISVDGSSVTQPISAAALPLPSGAASSALQTSGNASLTTIAGDTTSIDGKITQGSDSTLSNVQQVGCYAHNGSTWKQIHSTTAGNVKVSLEELNGSATGQQTMADSIPVVIASNQSEVSVTNAKITRGEGNITGGGNGLQQVLIYGKDQSGNLDPIDVDSQGHLKITIQDEEKSLTSVNLFVNQTLTANTPSAALPMNDKKNLQIVGKTSSSGAKIGIAFQGSGSDYYTNPEFAALYYNGVDYEFAMTVQGVGANNFKIYPQTNANNVYLTYHLF